MLDSTGTKLAATAVSKATARGAGATGLWSVLGWWLMVDQWGWFTSGGIPDATTTAIVGGIVVVFTGTLRMLERRWSWFGVLLLSQERPAYGAELDALVAVSDKPPVDDEANPVPPDDPALFWTGPIPVVPPVDDDMLGH